MNDLNINNTEKLQKFICIDIGGTSIKYSLADKNGNILNKNEIPTEALQKGGTGILNKIKSIISAFLIDDLITSIGNCDESELSDLSDNYIKTKLSISGICISTAGIVDHKEGKIIYALEKLIPNYTGLEIKSIIEEEFSKFNLKCTIENDVNCAGLGELWLGAGRGCSSAVCLTIGTGIGGCVIIDNKLIHGFSNSAGEVGYMFINNKSFQELASTTALVKNVALAKNMSHHKLNGKIIFDLIKKGDEVCLTELKKFVKILAIGISNICYVVNPEVVILGGGIMAQQEIIKPMLERELKQIFNPTIYKNTKIRFAQLENNAGMLGALYNFIS